MYSNNNNKRIMFNYNKVIKRMHIINNSNIKRKSGGTIQLFNKKLRIAIIITIIAATRLIIIIIIIRITFFLLIKIKTRKI